VLDRLNQLPAIANGDLAIAHSLGANPKKTLGDVRYLLFSPHDHHDADGSDPMGIKQIPNEIQTQLGIQDDLLKEYLDSERDKGIDPLSRAILARVPGGLLINSQINRGVVNLNQNVGEKGVLPAIWTPETRSAVEAPLRGIHEAQLNAYGKIVNALGNVPILHMHSMDNSGPKKNLRPELSHENLAGYVEAQGWGLDRRNPRLQDFITGKETGPYLADRKLYESLQRLFDQNGIQWALNAPYDTEEGYPDYEDMLNMPGRVSAVDITKDQLCTARGNTFDSRTAEVDPTRVGFMANLFATALEEKLSA
jgi:hypothetical protein